MIFFPADRTMAFFGRGDENGSDLSVVSLKAARVETEEVLPRIDGAGSIDYFEKVEINAKTSGRVSRFYVKEGQVVTRYQKLLDLERVFLELELTQQEASLEGAKSELRLAEEKYLTARREVEGRLKAIEKQSTLVKRAFAELEKMRATFEGKEILFNEGGISREEFSTIRTELIAREAAYRMAQKDLEIATIGFRDEDLKKRGIAVPEDAGKKTDLFIDLNTGVDRAQLDLGRSKVQSASAAMNSTRTLLREATILSPVDGVVSARNKSVGEQVAGGATGSPGQAILVLVDIHNVYSVMNVKESDLKDLQKGQVMEFKVDVYPKDSFHGTVEIINPVIDPKTHTLEVKAVLKNPGLRLRPGMFIRASVITGPPKQVILLPSSAVLPLQENKAYVFVIRDGVIFRSDVSTGRQHSDDRIEIESGIKPGDVVVTEKLSQLREGMRAQPVFGQ
ncbi:MAG: efflux RND transporter periplasmic adaptor subunit [Leptospirales bacterium]|nr:efflux RND transporter periplasmic adaptor subunit [Leptospirales bacterium]